MMLMDVPEDTWVETPKGHKFFFKKIEDYYAVGKEVGGAICRYVAHMEVKVAKDQPAEPK